LRGAQAAIDLGACRIININLAASAAIMLRDSSHCLDRNIPAWCGGMLGAEWPRSQHRRVNFPGYTLPGDVSASKRY
jgi:hypothetical protein